VEALLAAALAASAVWTPPAGPGTVVDYEEARPQGGFLVLDEAEAAALIPPAPAAGSAEDRSDLAELAAWQARRTPAECARAQGEVSPSYENLFGPLSPFSLPLDAEEKAFFLALAADAGGASYLLKRRYKRPRPFNRGVGLVPCVTRPKDWAYPSGHAAVGRVWALALADLVPARRAAFIARGHEVGLGRVIAGVHHPTDVAAGRLLADKLYARLRGEPAFQKALAALRARLP
jgi:acid phosphatase (class A)